MKKARATSTSLLFFFFFCKPLFWSRIKDLTSEARVEQKERGVTLHEELIDDNKLITEVLYYDDSSRMRRNVMSFITFLLI